MLEKEFRKYRKAITVGALTAGILSSGIGCAKQQTTEAPTFPSNNPTFNLEQSKPSTTTETQNNKTEPSPDGFISLGSEKDLSLEGLKLFWTPDGHIPYFSLSNGQKRYFTVGKDSTYLIATPGASLHSAIDNGLISQSSVKEVLGKEQNPNYNYSGITSIFQLDSDEKHLTAILHQEQWPSAGDGSGFTASVGVFESFDGGETWQNGRTIIQGDDFKSPGGERVSGAGQPNAIQVGNEIYIYFIDWSATNKHPDQIYLAKIGIENGTIDSQVEYYNGNGFSNDISIMKSVIPVPQNIQDAGYTALPSISFNKFLNEYLAVVETNVGFAEIVSKDGINWIQPEMIANFQQSQANRNTMDTWFSYPSLLSDDTQPNDHTTDQTGTLYFSKGQWNTTSHNMDSTPFEIK